MTSQNLIIYNFQNIFEILSEVKNNLNFKIIKLDKDELQSFNSKNYENFVFLTQKKILNVDNQLVLNQLPIKLNALVEKINIQFLKLNYQDQSNYIIGKYSINLNSKNISKENKNLKLTEKEISTILYLSKSKKSVPIKELQLNVWAHQSILETHTVETHIHRLRKKIKEIFNDESFIISSKDGYSIN